MPRLHLSSAIRLLESPEPVDITFLTAAGEIRSLSGVIGLRRQHYAGTRNIKQLPPDTRHPKPETRNLTPDTRNLTPNIRKIRDCLIISVNGCEVFL